MFKTHTLSRPGRFAAVLVLVLSSCVPPTSPYDPDAPPELQAPCGIEGTVVVEGRADASGVTLAVDGKSAVSDAAGRFLLEGLQPGRHTLRTVLGDGTLFRSVERAVDCASSDVTHVGVVELALYKGDLGGRALIDGSPTSEGIQLHLTRGEPLPGSDGVVTRSSVSAADGGFAFGEVPVGSYTLRAVKEGYAPAQLQLEVDPSYQTVGEDLVLYPMTGIVQIDDGAPYARAREVTLRLLGTNVPASHMKVSEDATFAEAELVEFAAESAFTLSDGDGEKRVYVRLYGDGVESPTFEGRVVLDRAPPSLFDVELANGAAYARAEDGVVPLRVSAEDLLSGLLAIIVSSDGAIDDEVPQPFSSSTTVTLPSGDGERSVLVAVVDRAGNRSLEMSASVVIDTEAPTPSLTPLVIEDGSGTVYSSRVTLLLDVAGASTMRLSNAEGLPGAPTLGYASAVSWELAPGEGDRTVYAVLTDEAGNTTAELSATVAVRFSGSIGGVVSVEDGADASGVVVSVNGTTIAATTGADGAFLLENVPQGLWAVSATAPGYVRHDFPLLTVTPGQTSGLESAVLRRLRGVIEGFALLDGEASHEGVRVSLGDAVAFTAPDGRFRMELPIGNYTGLVATHSARFAEASYEQTISVLASGSAQIPALTLAAVANDVVGHVTLAARSDHAGVTLALALAGGDERQTMSASDGSFAFPAVPLGAHTMHISYNEGWEEREVAVDVAAGPATTLPLLTLRERFLVIADYADVTSARQVALDLRSSDAATMQISEDPSFSGAATVPYATSRSFTLSAGDGTKTLYARFFDAGGALLGTAQDDIVLDATSVILGFTHDAVGPLARGATVRFRLDTGEPFGEAEVDVPGWLTGIPLYDDGTHGDEVPDDGVYEHLLPILTPNDVEAATPSGHFTDPNGLVASPAAASSSFTVRSAPLVSGIEVIPDPASGTALVSFTTDELATALVDHGPDNGYGASGSSSPAKLQHAVTLSGLSPSEEVHYRVRATDAHTSPSTAVGSERVFFMTPSPPPKVVAFGSDARVDVYWRSPPQRGLVGYHVYRGADFDTAVRLNGDPIASDPLLFSDGGGSSDNVGASAPTNGTPYTYFVTALDAFGGESPPSAAATATPASSSGAGTDVCGVSSDVIWTRSGSPYRVTCSFTLPAGVRIAAGPGTEVLVSPGKLLDVAGELLVVGGRVAGDEVRWRSSATTPSRADWQGLALRNDDDGLIEIVGAHFSHCNECLRAQPDADYDLVVRHSRFTDAQRALSLPEADEIFIVIESARVVIENNSFEDVSEGLHSHNQNPWRDIRLVANDFVRVGSVFKSDNFGRYLFRANLVEQSNSGIVSGGGANPARAEASLNRLRQNDADIVASLPSNSRPITWRYNDLLSTSSGGFGARTEQNGNHGEVDLRENFWGAAALEMEAGGGFVDISGIHDFYDDATAPRALYAPWLTAALPFAAGRDAMVLEEDDVVIDLPSGEYTTAHTWRGARWYATPTASVELSLSSDFAELDVYEAPSFDSAASLTGGFVAAGPAVTVTLPDVAGHHPLVVVARDSSGRTSTPVLVHVIVDDGTTCPGERWVVDPRASRCVTP